MNYILLAIKQTALGTTKFKSLIHSQMFFNAEKNTLKVTHEGIDKAGSIDKKESEEVQDSASTQLRTLFIAKAGKIDGKVIAVDIVIDWLNNINQSKVYYESLTGEKCYKKFDL